MIVNVQHVIQIKNGIEKHVNVNVKIIAHGTKDYSSNSSTCNRENNKYLIRIADTSVIACDLIMSVMDIVLRKKKNMKQQMCQ